MPVGVKLQHDRKSYLVAMKGGVCHKCGGEFPDCVYDFHHRLKAFKEWHTGPGLRSSEDTFQHRIVPEIRDKCDMLCANCHRILHHDKKGGI